MAISVDDTSQQIARCLRQERDVRGWSLADLASRSGVAKATISKIEREEASPTAVVLVRLAGAFDLTLAGLLLRAEGEGKRLTRAHEQPVWRDPDTGYLRKQVFAHRDHPLEIVEVELPAKATIEFPPSSYARIRQAIWVRSGELTIVEGSERQVLREGDCLGFGPPSEVKLANETDRPCLYIVALSRSSPT